MNEIKEMVTISLERFNELLEIESHRYKTMRRMLDLDLAERSLEISQRMMNERKMEIRRDQLKINKIMEKYGLIYDNDGNILKSELKNRDYSEFVTVKRNRT